MNETMLFFVGEEIEVMTLASKKAETSLDAPAVAVVIDSREIGRRGVTTLAQLLETEPGFYMNRRASGTVPYLRGVQDGILFLYDGIPMTTNATRNANALDYELPLSNVKRVEIVRGPGSVLWGADAFAGIVNVVPYNGRDIKGVDAEAFAGSNRYRGGSVMGGKKFGDSDAFLSVYYAGNRYHKTDYKADTFGSKGGSDKKTIDDSHYLELTGNANMGSKIRLSGRLSDNRREYVLNDSENLSWLGQKESPSGFVKGIYSDQFKGVDLTLTGYAQYIEYNVTNVDIRTKQSDWIYGGDLLVHKPFSNQNQVTMGSSFRRSYVDGAPGENDFLPSSLKPDNAVFVPGVDQVDYNNTLVSFFGQYRHRWGDDMDSFAGLRYDNHSDYENTLSYNLGFNRRLAEDFRMKFIFGSAFRTPFPNQLIGIEPLEPEKNNTANIQFLWNRERKTQFSLSLFYSAISNYVFEDPFGGLSMPSDLEIWGAELAGRMVVNSDLDLFGSFTVLNDKADNIRYRVPAYTFVQPDGTKKTFYEQWSQPYDSGPKYIAALGCSWRFLPGRFLTAGLKWTGDVPYSFDKHQNVGTFSITPVLSLGVKWQEFLGTRFDVSLKADNIFDTRNFNPGLYGPAEDIPFQVHLRLATHF